MLYNVWCSLFFFIYIYIYIYIYLHWLPISTRIEYKVLLIVLKTKMEVALKYLHDAIRPPTSATSLHFLRSMDRRELFVPRTRTTMAMSRSFAVIAPSLWNRLPPSARASLSSSNLSTSLSLLKTCLFSWSLSNQKRLCLPMAVEGCYINTNNTIQ